MKYLLIASLLLFAACSDMRMTSAKLTAWSAEVCEDHNGTYNIRQNVFEEGFTTCRDGKHFKITNLQDVVGPHVATALNRGKD